MREFGLCSQRRDSRFRGWIEMDDENGRHSAAGEEYIAAKPEGGVQTWLKAL